MYLGGSKHTAQGCNSFGKTSRRSSGPNTQLASTCWPRQVQVVKNLWRAEWAHACIFNKQTSDEHTTSKSACSERLWHNTFLKWLQGSTWKVVLEHTT